MHQSSDHSSITPPIHPGDQVGKYRIDAQIGSGGGAIVWRAIDPLLNRAVAIKQLAPSTLDMDTHASQQHFAKEAQLGRELSAKDPKHLVQVHEYLADPRGLFIVMEYVEGSSLETIIKKLAAPMPPKQTLGIVAATAMGLQHLHDHGVVHRDLKPANILMPASGGLKICDFGLASLIGEMDSMAAGSVRYMAPELTSNENVDGRADLYSLGMIAYEMLAGREKFEQAFRFVLKDQRNQSLRWMKWHANQRAKATPLHELVPEIDKTLSDLVERLMAKDVNQRIASGNELVKTIKMHFIGEADKPLPPEVAHATTHQTAHSGVFSGNDEIPGSDEPTAMLPKKSRLPYYLGGVIVILTLVLGIMVLGEKQKQKQAQQQQLATLKSQYNQAYETFVSKDFVKAANQFTELAKILPDRLNKAKLKSQSYQLWAEGYLHRTNNAFQAAVDAFIAAEESGVLKPIEREQLQVLIRETQRQAAFANQISQIEQLISEQKFNLARQQLIEQNSYAPTKEEQKTLDEFNVRLNAMVGQSQIMGFLTEAQQLVDTSRRDEAIALLEEKHLRYPNHLLTQKISELKQQRNYEQALLDARTAHRNNQYAQAIEHYSRAQQIKEDTAISQQINQLRAQMAYQSGVERERAGDPRGATTYYSRALSFADMREAREAIARIDNQTARQTLVSAGDNAAAAQNYSTAIKHYQNAMKMSPDASVRQKIITVQTQLHYTTGKRALENQQLDKALTELTAARNLAPNDNRINTALSKLQTLTAYTKERDAGDASRKKGEFGSAKRAYNRAKKIISKDEIKKRLDDTEYEHLVARAKHRISIKSYDQARILLKLASKIHNTQEVRQLMAQLSEE